MPLFFFFFRVTLVMLKTCALTGTKCFCLLNHAQYSSVMFDDYLTAMNRSKYQMVITTKSNLIRRV